MPEPELVVDFIQLPATSPSAPKTQAPACMLKPRWPPNMWLAASSAWAMPKRCLIPPEKLVSDFLREWYKLQRSSMAATISFRSLRFTMPLRSAM